METFSFQIDRYESDNVQFKVWATWTESVEELQNSIVYLPSISEESMEAMKNALSIYNLGISPEVRANLTQVSVAVSNAMKTVNQLDFQRYMRLFHDLLK